jgi:predicted CoA-binding protein
MTTTRTARDILAEASTIAVVGASRYPHKAAAEIDYVEDHCVAVERALGSLSKI